MKYIKWEYQFLYWEGRNDRERHALLNDFGRNGWEMVTADNLGAWMKRQVLK